MISEKEYDKLIKCLEFFDTMRNCAFLGVRLVRLAKGTSPSRRKSCTKRSIKGDRDSGTFIGDVA